MSNKEKREKCFKYGLPILNGIVFGTFVGYITKTALGFVVGFICGSFVWVHEFRKPPPVGEGR